MKTLLFFHFMSDFCIFEDNLAHDFIMNSAKFGTSFSQDAMHVGM